MKNKILTFISVLFGALMINGGLDKFFHYMPMPENLPQAMIQDMNALTEIIWLMPLIAVAEILGGLLIMFPKTRALGALILFPVMVGVLLTNIFVDTAALPMVIVIWAILLWILWDNKSKYLPLIR